MAKEYSFKDLQNKLKKINPFGGPIAESAFSKVTEFIHTGNYHLNAVLSGSVWGGVPNNRSIQLAAPSGCGKTFVLLNICREVQQMGYIPIYYDTEGAVDIDNIKNFGIDPENFDHQPVSDLNTFRTSITTLTKELIEAKKSGAKIPKIAIFLDSLGMLATSKEIEDAQSGSDKSDMTRAKVIRSLFRIITSDLTGLGIPLLYTNHTYDCLQEGTQIRVINDKNEILTKRIEELKIGNIVPTLGGNKPVTNVFVYDEAELIEIELEDGQILKCTPNHKFLIHEDWRLDSSWKFAKDLTEEDTILKV